MMLEDDFTYVIRKAFKGLDLAPAEAARLARLPESEVLAFSRGKFSMDTARRLAPVLGLNPEALAHHDHYLPKPLELPEIHRIDLPFGDERVNAWLVWTNDSVVLFDTGYNPLSCTVALDAIAPPALQQLFITHGHVDHVGGIADFVARGVIPRGASIGGALPCAPGDSIACGALTIRACDLSGHANPALGFLIDGLATPVLVTGDALFAGSIGGCANPRIYQHALGQLRKILTPLSDDTILLPGHGPATTLGEERISNPFL
jgi:glyoxylase-like metal-dependent hydrolase (beta-lactamase superfamily II)